MMIHLAVFEARRDDRQRIDFDRVSIRIPQASRKRRAVPDDRASSWQSPSATTPQTSGRSICVVNVADRSREARWLKPVMAASEVRFASPRACTG
jgi:hypothetical protein